MKIKRKTVLQLAGIVICSALMFTPGVAYATQVKAFNVAAPGLSMSINRYPVVTVRSGDTLSSISQKYNLPWQGVYCANKKTIGPNPNLLSVGMQLIMKSISCSWYSGYGKFSNAITTAEYELAGTPQHIAWELLANFGGTRPIQFYCLNNIIGRESGWRTNAYNPSGAYGIPQALPGSKMSVAGSDWQTSAYTQLKWMIKYYIPSTYGTPCGAWSFWSSHGWY